MGERERTGEEREQERRPARAAGERTPAPAGAPGRLASAVGNRAFAQVMRAGGGLLPSGQVHPYVQSAIDATRGGGRPLDDKTRAQMSGAVGDPLGDVRIHTDASAGDLARAVDARAFTTGRDIYFGAGEYRPGDAAGNRLIAHELTHVAQQRGAPTSGPLTVTDPGDAQEMEAETVARGLSG